MRKQFTVPTDRAERSREAAPSRIGFIAIDRWSASGATPESAMIIARPDRLAAGGGPAYRRGSLAAMEQGRRLQRIAGLVKRLVRLFIFPCASNNLACDEDALQPR